VSFLFWIWLKPATVRVYLPNYIIPFGVFVGIWLASSIFMQKYRGLQRKSLRGIVWGITSANLIAVSISAIIIYGFRIDFFSRQVVFGTVAVASGIEFIGAYIIYSVIHATEELEIKYIKPKVENYYEKPATQFLEKKYEPRGVLEEKLKKSLIATCGQTIYDILTESVNPFYEKTLVLSTTTQFNVDKQPDEYFENIINIRNVNDIRFINKFSKAVNYKLPIGGLFVGCGETKDMRKRRILEHHSLIINYFVYTLDYLFGRILPKFQITKPIYYFITKGQNRVLSKAEILGRLYYCGFELVREVTTKDKYFFIVHKVAHHIRHPDRNMGFL
jgi:hypothetical protein